MNYVIEKHFTKKYEITEMNPFVQYRNLLGVIDVLGLKTPKTCFSCGKKFFENDFMYLGLVKGDKNRLFCETCGRLIGSIIDIKE